MFGLFGLGMVLFVGAAVIGLLWAALSLVMWVLFLPFHLLRFAFHGLAALFLLPFVFLVLTVVAIAVGLPLLFAVALPLLPLVLVAAAVVWLARRLSRPSPVR